MNASENINLKLLLEAVLHFHLHADGLGYLHVASATTKINVSKLPTVRMNGEEEEEEEEVLLHFLILCSLQQTEMRVAESRGKDVVQLSINHIANG